LICTGIKINGRVIEWASRRPVATGQSEGILLILLVHHGWLWCTKQSSCPIPNAHITNNKASWRRQSGCRPHYTRPLTLCSTHQSVLFSVCKAISIKLLQQGDKQTDRQTDRRTYSFSTCWIRSSSPLDYVGINALNLVANLSSMILLA
jgi:hypothetical protein